MWFDASVFDHNHFLVMESLGASNSMIISGVQGWREVSSWCFDLVRSTKTISSWLPWCGVEFAHPGYEFARPGYQGSIYWDH